MGRICSVDAILDTPTDAATIRKILIRGSKLGILYYDREKHIAVDDFFWSADESTTFIMKVLNCESEYYIKKLPFITFSFEYSSCAISFEPHKNGMYIDITPTGKPWIKENIDSKFSPIDFGRYLELLLNVCRDFAILEISTYDEYFNE